MNRRAFLALAGPAALLQASARAQTQDAYDSVCGNPDYRLLAEIDRVDCVFVERNLAPDGRVDLDFSNDQTTPEGDRNVVVQCSHEEPGIHVGGSVQHKTTLWIPRKGTSCLMIIFESTAAIRVFRHVDRGKEIALEAVAYESPIGIF